MVEPVAAPAPPAAPRADAREPLRRRLAVLLVVASLVVLADQLTKRAVDARLRGRVMAVMPGFDLRYARNPGAAWGLLADLRETYRRPFFVGISLFAIGFMLFTYARTGRDQLRLRLALALLLGGALGNFIDRLAYGYVIDFIDWHARIFGRLRHWPTFNIADAGITVGVLLLALELFPRRAPRTVAADGRSRGDDDPAAATPPSPPAP